MIIRGTVNKSSDSTIKETIIKSTDTIIIKTFIIIKSRRHQMNFQKKLETVDKKYSSLLLSVIMQSRNGDFKDFL